MKRILLALTAITLLSTAWGIVSLPGSGDPVFPTPPRTYSFSYSNGNADLSWYGSPQWAVLFDFKAAYPSLSLAQFAISGAQIYFPVTGDSVTVELFTDSANQPQTRVAQIRSLVSQNLMQFAFPTTIQTEKIWLLVTYNTNYYGPYMSASNGGGSHSYYLNTNVSVPYFQSMATAGFNCEFLISVQGEYLLSNPDLELQSFALEGDLLPGASVAPAFTIYNHSTGTINNASIALQISSPTTANYSLETTIPIISPIAPKSSLSVDAASIPYLIHHFNLPANPMQIKVRAILSSENAADTLFNNSKTIYYNIFEHENPVIIAENFLRNTEVEMLGAAQANPPSERLHSLFYFPVLADSLSNLGAVNRYSWYSLFSTPVTVIGGTERISGYGSTYQNQFNQLVLTHSSDKSLINTGQAVFVLPQQGENLQIQLSLRNASTHLFNSATEPNLLTSSRFFVAFFKKTAFENRDLYVFNRWIAFADTINGSLQAGETARKSYQTSLSNIDLNDLAMNYRLFYWFQHLNTGTMLYANYSDLNTIMSADDEIHTPPAFSCYPNPLSGTRNLTLKSGDAAGVSSCYSIFNLRGQQLWSSGSVSRSDLPLEVPRTVFTGSGIYIVRMETTDAKGRKQRFSKKITIY
ncbi:MAG TPA: T9SS type A sorting domain-containing protein [Candidatus Cloacimonadota bacterium]|nr:T9SS type A sorting domain-containing protein [Candidatus Cloacimonadota bacterium]